jgi:hypothetical protein
MLEELFSILDSLASDYFIIDFLELLSDIFELLLIFLINRDLLLLLLFNDI